MQSHHAATAAGCHHAIKGKLADPMLADRGQRTPLHRAADCASECCLKQLLQARISSLW